MQAKDVAVCSYIIIRLQLTYDTGSEQVVLQLLTSELLNNARLLYP